MSAAKSLNRGLLRFQVCKIHWQIQATVQLTSRSGSQRWQAEFFRRCLLFVDGGLVFGSHDFGRPTSSHPQVWLRKHSASQMCLNDASGDHRFYRVRGRGDILAIVQTDASSRGLKV
jgi:hypothetical protein